MRPVKIHQQSSSQLSIEWDDHHHGRHRYSSLRTYCPCASCKMEIESTEGMITLPILKPGQYELQGIEPVGSYALQLVWGDGHRTGIYTYDYLRQICECEECMKKTEE